MSSSEVPSLVTLALASDPLLPFIRTRVRYSFGGIPFHFTFPNPVHVDLPRQPLPSGSVQSHRSLPQSCFPPEDGYSGVLDDYRVARTDRQPLSPTTRTPGNGAHPAYSARMQSLNFVGAQGEAPRYSYEHTMYGGVHPTNQNSSDSALYHRGAPNGAHHIPDIEFGYMRQPSRGGLDYNSHIPSQHSPQVPEAWRPARRTDDLRFNPEDSMGSPYQQLPVRTAPATTSGDNFSAERGGIVGERRASTVDSNFNQFTGHVEGGDAQTGRRDVTDLIAREKAVEVETERFAYPLPLFHGTSDIGYSPPGQRNSSCFLLHRGTDLFFFCLFISSGAGVPSPTRRSSLLSLLV